MVPLPDVPCLRVRLVYEAPSIPSAGNRFYVAYSGTAPSGANCNTYAADVAAAWETYLAAVTPGFFALLEVDVLDIATDSGLSGHWTGSNGGARSGTTIPDNVAVNVEFDIARRYRGGKPRMFLPPGVAGDLNDMAQWGTSFVSDVQSGVDSFFNAVTGLTVGGTVIGNHVNLSYYKGFTNITNSSGRERAVPTYRATAIHDNVEGYAVKAVVGSQRRRRTSSSP